MADKTGTIKITASTELGELQKLNGALDKMGDNFAKMVSGANLLNKGIDTLTSSIKETLSYLDAYSKATQIFTGNLEKLKEATKGNASALDIMQAHNKMVTLGLKLSEEEFQKLFAAATRLAPAMGITLKEALESVATGLSRKSKAVMDNIGVVVDAEKAQKDFAKSIGKTASALSDAEKDLAWTTDAIKQMGEKSKATAEVMTTATSAVSKLGVAFKDGLLGPLDQANKAFGRLMTTFMNAPNAIQRAKMLRGEIVNISWDMVASLGGFDPSLGGLVTGIKPGGGIDVSAIAKRFGEKPVQKYDPKSKQFFPFEEKEVKRHSTGGAKDTSSPFGIREWVYDSLANIEIRAKEMIEEQGERHRKLMQKNRGEDVEAGGEQQRAQLGLEFKEFAKQKGREKKGGDLRDTFAGGMFGDEAYQAAIRSAEGFEIYRDMVSKTNAELQGMAEGGMKTAFNGMLELADAAVSGQGNIGKMALNMLKSVSIGLAQQLFAMGVAAQFKAAGLAASVVGLPFAAAAEAESAIYFAGAATLGAMGLGLSAVSASVGGGHASGGGGGAGASSAPGYRPSFGTKTSSRDLPPIVVRVTFDRSDPASVDFARRKVKADIEAAGYGA